MIRPLGVVAFLASARILAATVEVSVVERGGGPVSNQIVFVYSVTPDIQADPLYFLNTRPAGGCTTGEAGRCQIEGLPVGVYFPNLVGIADPNLAGASGPPIAAYGTVTLGKPQAKAPLRIELQRGVRIHFRVVSEKAPVPPRSRVELTSDSGEKAIAPFDASGNARITLGSGRFIAHLAGPQGARVVMVELDGAELSTLDVPVELRAPSSDRFVTWTLSAPCRILGTVTSDCEPPRSGIGATLVAPGSWGASALCRARSCIEPTTTTLRPKGDYTLELPSGTWRIATTGESLLESTPPFIEVSCAEGESARADFRVREECDGGTKPVLIVLVVGPDEQPIAGVQVEVWPSTGNLNIPTPLATEVTGRDWMAARFTELPAGSYLIRARRSGYRTVVSAVPDLDPEAPHARTVTLRLDKGAAIDAIVTDDMNRPVAGVGLIVRRTDVPQANSDPATRLAEPEAEISVAPGNDQTGHVVVTGLAGGGYDVTPVLSGTLASAATATVAGGDEPGHSHALVQLADSETRELAVRVLPAAFFAGRLLCADGGLHPHQADTCLLGLPSGDEDEPVRAACKNPVQPTKAVTLIGDRYDEFRVGPLTLGSYRLGLRPRGYTSWTWALGTPDGAQAAVVQVNGAGAVDLGAIPALCGPAIELRPSVLSRDPLPDLTLAAVMAELTRTSPDGKVERRVVPAEWAPDRATLRELPEGEWTLNVTMSHPFFVPSAPVKVSAALKLERGVQIAQRIEIASVGGAVAIDAPTGAARLSRPDGTSRIEAAKEGMIAINGLTPDVYLVELCEDSRCERVLRRWDGVRVVRGKKALLAIGDILLFLTETIRGQQP